MKNIMLKAIGFGLMAFSLSGCVIAIGDDWDDHHFSEAAQQPQAQQQTGQLNSGKEK